MNHEKCDLILDYFNGHLSEEEMESFKNHAASCADCQELLMEMEELNETMPYSSAPLSPPEGMKTRILANVLNEPAVETEEKVVHLPKKKNSLLLPSVAAALFLSVAGNVYLLNQSESKKPEKEISIVDHTTKFVELKPQEGTAAGTASMVKRGKENNLVVQATGLSGLKAKEVYQVWLIEKDNKVRAGSFIPASDGRGSVVFKMNGLEEKKWDTVAITLEPDEKSQTPKGNIVLAAGL